jgi:MFS family permease
VRQSDGYAWFVAGVASWFGAQGMQAVLFSWLAVGELHMKAEWVGVAQSTPMLMSLLLLLLGGTLADRFDPRGLLIGLHGLAALPAAGLAWAVASGHLTLPILIAYGAAMGAVSAFAMPARDTLLSRVAGPRLLRAVAGMTATQFGAQAAGTLLAGAAGWLGNARMLGAQALVLVSGAVFAARLAPAAPVRRTVREGPIRALTAGLAHVVRDPNLRGPTVLLMAVGVLFVGPFLVVFPLLVRDHYHGDQAELSIVLMLFPLGTILGSLLMRTLGSLRRKGLAALLALVGGAFALGVVGFGVPYPVMLASLLVWGACGAVFINCSRTLYQEHAPEAERGRALAVYQLSFMGAAPLGALSSGIVSGEVGPLMTLRLFAAGMLVLVALVFAFGSTASIE